VKIILLIVYLSDSF